MDRWIHPESSEAQQLQPLPRCLQARLERFLQFRAILKIPHQIPSLWASHNRKKTLHEIAGCNLERIWNRRLSVRFCCSTLWDLAFQPRAVHVPFGPQFWTQKFCNHGRNHQDSGWLATPPRRPLQIGVWIHLLDHRFSVNGMLLSQLFTCQKNYGTNVSNLYHRFTNVHCDPLWPLAPLASK